MFKNDSENTVYFDLDGTLFDTTAQVNKILDKEFPQDAPHTHEQWKAYKTDECFKGIKVQTAINAWANPKIYNPKKIKVNPVLFKVICGCVEKGMAVKIYSLCWSEEMAVSKRKLVNALFPKEVEFIYTVDAKHKPAPTHGLAFFEDLHKNLAPAGTKLKFIVEQEWNKNYIEPTKVDMVIKGCYTMNEEDAQAVANSILDMLIKNIA